MYGVIDYLLSSDPQAVELRRKCIFKIVPMLNPDGVVNGRFVFFGQYVSWGRRWLTSRASHRCSLAGIDLNRQWQTPCRQRAPTIWWTKRLWSFLVEEGHRPLVIMLSFMQWCNGNLKVLLIVIACMRFSWTFSTEECFHLRMSEYRSSGRF